MKSISLNALKFVSMNNQEYQVRPTMVSVNSNKSLFYPYRIIVDKCCGSCNDFNNLYAKLCVPDVVKTWILNYLIWCQGLMKYVTYLDMKLVGVNVD